MVANPRDTVMQGIELNGQMEVRDKEGRVVAFVVPCQVWDNLVLERDALRCRLEKLIAEHEVYRKALQARLAIDVDFSPEEIAELRQEGLSFDEVTAGVSQLFPRDR
jgi:hypothetical protein